MSAITAEHLLADSELHKKVELFLSYLLTAASIDFDSANINLRSIVSLGHLMPMYPAAIFTTLEKVFSCVLILGDWIGRFHCSQ